MAKAFPLIGVWVEREGQTFLNMSTANIEGARGSCDAWALNAIRSGAQSASVREFDLAEPEAAARGADAGKQRLLRIFDWRDLPEFDDCEEID